MQAEQTLKEEVAEFLKGPRRPRPFEQVPTIYHGGISGGKDSTALMLWMRYESGYPLERLQFTFCDTGNESDETYAHVQMLSERVHPVVTIYPPLDYWALARKKQRMPSPRARFCTTELKMYPTKAHIDALKAEGHRVLMLSGVRAGESDDRAKLPEREPWYENFFETDQYRPLLRWSLDDVWAIHRRYGIPRNPMYDKGFTRVGCQLCHMSRKKGHLYT